MTDKHFGEAAVKRLMYVAWVILAVFLVHVPLVAQSGAGAIQGTVTDTTGAVIPKASIVVVNQATAQSYSTATNEAGFYSVPGLFAGNYAVTFSARGMKQCETRIALQVAQSAVISPVLSPGAVTEKVVVNAETIQMVTYDNGTVSTELDNTRIDQLPMNGRNLLTLTGETTPGLEAGGTRSNGLLNDGTEYVQDGAPLINLNAGGPAQQADPDSVQEVKVETSSSNAMYAEPSTAVITTKSGTNEVHGSAFETARNNAVGIARSRSNPSNFTAPKYIRNEFGASLGGPIRIPGLYNGKDKSFFFFAYERYSLRSGSYLLGTVPTLAMRQGDFSGAVNSNGQLQTIYDPNTTNPSTYQRQPFSNNQIPLGRISPFTQTLYAITPAPTNSQNPLVQPNLNFIAASNQTAPQINLRLDHRFNYKNSAYLRYSSYSSNTISAPSSTMGPAATIAGAGLPAGVSDLGLTTATQYSFALGFTHTFSPTFVSQTVLGNTWQTVWNGLNPNGTGTVDWESKLGLPNNFGELGFPNIPAQGSTVGVPTGTNGSPLYALTGTQSRWGGPEIISNIDEDLTKTLGKHEFYFGGRYRHNRLGVLPDRTPDGINFNGMGTGEYNPASGTGYTALPNTGMPDGDLFLGNASYYNVRLNVPYEHWRGQEFDAYVQDDWHFNERLTFNLGLRWEAHPVSTVQDNVFNGFDLKNHATVLGAPIQTFINKGYTTQAIITNLQNLGVVFETPSQAGLPPHMVYGSNAIFDPRLGVAYSPFGSGRGTVVRAGFGRYAYPIPLRNFYASGKTNAPFAASYFQDYTSGAQSPDGGNNYILRSPQTVIAGQNSANVVNSSSINAILPGINELVLNPHYPPNLVWEFNTTVEQPLKPESVLRVSYVYDKGTNLDQLNELNYPMSNYVWEVKTGTTPPGGLYSGVALNPYDNKVYGGVLNAGLVFSDRNGWSQYNALQANYQRQYMHGYGYQLIYVYARAMRVGGNTFRDSIIYPYGDYAPGAAPSSTYDGLNRFQNYKIDSAIPEHHISFNGVVDLSIGRGKRLLTNANRFVDELVGGYQVAFDGSILSQYFQPSSSNWGGYNPMNTGSKGNIHVYKKKYKITDCSSGKCLPGYLWYNGFISPLLTSNPCGPNLITGLPTNYQPYQTPINMDPGTISCVNGKPKASNPNYLTNNVQVPLNNGSTATVGYSPGPGLNPFAKTYLHGPFNWSSDISIFKVFPITERVNLRVNIDAFNAFNVQGYTNPNSGSGIQYFTSSYNTPRQVQLTGRLTF